MPDLLSILLAAACAASFLGLAWLALAMEVHWKQVRGHIPLTETIRTLLRGLGVLDLGLSLALCMAADHGSMAALVWIMLLAASAVSLALVLAWRPLWLKPLVAWTPQDDARRRSE